MTQNLVPLGNIFACRDEDPAARAQIRVKLGAYGGLSIAELGNWLIAVDPLPGPPIGLRAEGDSAPTAVWAEGGRRSAEELSRRANLAIRDPARLAQCDGDFGGIVFDGETAVVVRSCGGLVPWLVMQEKGRTFVSTRVAWFARFLASPPEPDLLVHATFADGITLPDRRSPWRGATCLRAGTAVVLQAQSAPRTVRYWNLVDRVPSRSSSVTRVESVAREFRAELVRRLGDELADDGSNLMALSGGVDSSCLASLASGVNQKRFSAFSFCGPDSDDTTEEFKYFVDVIARATNPIRHSLFQYTDQQRCVLSGNGLRLGCPVAHPALIELPALAAANRLSVYCGGEFADDLLAGPFLLWGDWFHQLDAKSFFRSLFARNRPITRKGLTRLWAQELVHRKLFRSVERFEISELATIVAPEIRAEHAEWKYRAMGELPTIRDPYAHLQVACERDGWLLQNWEVASEVGVRRSVPFVGRAILELAVSLHPADHALPPKRILRLGLAGDVPEENLWRIDKGSTKHFSLVSATIPGLVRRVLNPALHDTVESGQVIDMMPNDAKLVSVLAASLEPVAFQRTTDFRS